ncbi:HEAT repeat domain-containing protein [Nocardiopsis sp. EMB25]|uniref:HEAT repeat domain-containing protein n=1 Tax=Nocardiopsis sp. EMB25 TaxID=2835867 RepID=UPI0022841CF6|nr:HEAT repeat domain-containing protein [Nocardiopsis sp. EMB25]MCY9784489.1 HEAT repeat domain-containing protein [Nocardiopsis sp. EMB25]
MGEAWDAVAWSELEHNHGSAEDVPDLLRRCAAPDPDDADEAAFDLFDHLFHQGGWICPAASAALPFVVRLAASPHVPARDTLMELVARLVSESRLVEEGFLDPAWPAAWERALPKVLDLLRDRRPRIRRAAAEVVRECADPGEAVLEPLLRCWEAETDPVTRLDLLLALGAAAHREPVGEHGGRVLALLDGLLDAPDPQSRLAAVHALAPGDPDLPTRKLEQVLTALRDSSVGMWRHTTLECGARGLQLLTAGLLTPPSTAYALGLLADHPDEEQRVGGLAHAAEVLGEWRSPVPDLLPAIAARLDDPTPEVRYRSVELLACLGTAAAPYADRIAALLDDHAVRGTRVGQTVGEAALWALARLNDPRCTPRLVDSLHAERSGFSRAFDHYPASPHTAVLPALPEVLARLPEHVDALLPAVRELLLSSSDQQKRASFCETLDVWGAASAPALPEVLDLLADGDEWAVRAAASAVAATGTAARDAAEALLARAFDDDLGGTHAAWAHWRVTGDPDPALRALASAVARDHPHPALRLLAELGPLASGFADSCVSLAVSGAPPSDWTRVEAAHALWRITGDPERALPVLLGAVGELPRGRYLPVHLTAVRYLARMGPAARPAADLLRCLPDIDRRLRYFGAWRGFIEDEEIRAAVRDLRAAVHGGGPSG